MFRLRLHQNLCSLLEQVSLKNKTTGIIVSVKHPKYNVICSQHTTVTIQRKVLELDVASEYHIHWEISVTSNLVTSFIFVKMQ